MGIIAEQNQWFKSKHEVLDEYDDKHRVLQSAIASRNFLKPPGFLFEASIGLEENSKKKLSILNYQIVAEAIERELKQTGHDYNIIYKNARIAFELDKQTLLTALQQEFADLDAAQSLSEEEVNIQFVELDLRRIILITTKTAIGLEMEGLKQELIDIDRLTFDNEVLLMEEKVITAELKLTVIPYIEAIIVAQERVLVAEEANIPYTEDLLEEKQLLIEKKEEIIPYLEDKSAELIKLATAILAAIEIEGQRLDVALSKAELGMDKVDNTLSIIEAEKAIEVLRSLLYAARQDLQIIQVDRQISLTDLSSTNINEVSIERTGMMTALEKYKSAIASSIRNAKGIAVDEDIEGDEESTALSVAAEKLAIYYTAQYQKDAGVESAEISAAADITSKLIHLIGS